MAESAKEFIQRKEEQFKANLKKERRVENTTKKEVEILGLILNLLGAVCLALAITKVPCGIAHTQCGENLYQIAYIRYPDLVTAGLFLIIAGFFIQFVLANFRKG